MADFLNGLYISEILADNAGGQAVDVDGDGNTSKADEFIELGNASGASVSLAGYQIWSEKNGLLYSFANDATLNPGDAATVVGNYTTPPSVDPPSGFYSAGIAENGNFIPDGEGNKFDSIFLLDTNTGDYIVLSYGQPPRAPTLPFNPLGKTQIGAGESIQSTAPNGAAFARDASGTLIETTPTPNVPNIACFTQDTWILTNSGEQRVQDLRPGMHIPTFDLGRQELLGTCRVHVPVGTLLRAPSLRPVTIDAHNLGTDQDLCVSPAHCVLHRSARAETLFAQSDVLVRARHYRTAGQGRVDMPRNGVTYFHLLFEEHALVMANGVWSESYFNADDAPERADTEAEWTFARGVSLDSTPHTKTVRPVLRQHEAFIVLQGTKPEQARRQNQSNVVPMRRRAAG